MKRLPGILKEADTLGEIAMARNCVELNDMVLCCVFEQQVVEK